MLSCEFIAFVIWNTEGEAKEQGCYNVSEVEEILHLTVNTVATIIKVLQVDRNMGLALHSRTLNASSVWTSRGTQN